MPRNPGELFAGYTIIRLIGRGGMGEIYLARHPHLPRDEALKVLPADLSRDPMYRQRFVREAELASSVVHPAIVTIFNSGEFDGHLWIAMEYIDGIDALKLLRRHPEGLDDETVVAVARSVGAALDRAHSTGLLHRDVKPANILMQGAGGPEPRVLLADFGIAKSERDMSHLTSTNMFLGTVAYSAPEQLIGEHVDGRADQYSLAATTFELLTGHPPFEGTSSASIIARHLNSTAPAASTVRPGISPAVDAVLMRALAKEPGRRFGSCREFAASLADAITTRGPRPAVPSPAQLPTAPPAPFPAAPQSPPPQPFPASAYPPEHAYPGQPYPQSAYRGQAWASSGPPEQPYGAGSPYPGAPGSGPLPAAPGSGPIPAAPQRRQRSGALIGLSLAAAVLLVAIVAGALYVTGAISGAPDDAATSTPPTVGTTPPAAGPAQNPATRTPETAPVTVTGPAQVVVGDCISVAAQAAANGSVVASKVGCDTSGLNFYAASVIPATAQCPSDQNSSITFPASPDKLCLTPNFYAGLCYVVPLRGGSLADFREAQCSDAAPSRAVLARVTNRSSAAVDCASGETRWAFDQPQSIGYCLVEV